MGRDAVRHDPTRRSRIRLSASWAGILVLLLHVNADLYGYIYDPIGLEVDGYPGPAGQLAGQHVSCRSVRYWHARVPAHPPGPPTNSANPLTRPTNRPHTRTGQLSRDSAHSTLLVEPTGRP
jgi:hypothetical protein